MFEGLTKRISDTFRRLRRRAVLSESDIDTALQEIRSALLEADVALPVVKEFLEAIRSKAVGREVLQSVTPAQQVIKVVHDQLVELLGNEATPLTLDGSGDSRPVVILLVGLQGAGKTTTAGKLAYHLKNRHRKRVLLTSLDVQRPAAREQLQVLAGQAGVDASPIGPERNPVRIARQALEQARDGRYQVVIFDSAGRLAVDQSALDELQTIAEAVQPLETLLVADAMTGQDAWSIATGFGRSLSLTGIVLTRLDSDARGGAALSLRHITGKPIKLLGVGEKIDALETFHPERLAGRILGQGDVVALVEKATALEQQNTASETTSETRAAQGQFDFNDLLAQLRKLRKMGGVVSMLKLIPAGMLGKDVSSMVAKTADHDHDLTIRRQEAMILSMTKAERRDVRLLNGSRRRRIAAGAGVQVTDVNRMVKQFQTVHQVVKKQATPANQRKGHPVKPAANKPATSPNKARRGFI